MIKTLVMEDDAGKPMIVLMHGDREVSTRALARIVGVKTIVARARPTSPIGTPAIGSGAPAPFGPATPMPIHGGHHRRPARVYVNGGKRGYLVGWRTAELVRLVEPTLVTASQAPARD